MKKKAIQDLKEYLRTRSKKDKDVLWEWLDGDPRATEEMIKCVGTKNGRPNQNTFNRWNIKVPAGEESLPGSPFSAP